MRGDELAPRGNESACLVYEDERIVDRAAARLPLVRPDHDCDAGLSGGFTEPCGVCRRDDEAVLEQASVEPLCLSVPPAGECAAVAPERIARDPSLREREEANTALASLADPEARLVDGPFQVEDRRARLRDSHDELHVAITSAAPATRPLRVSQRFLRENARGAAALVSPAHRTTTARASISPPRFMRRRASPTRSSGSVSTTARTLPSPASRSSSCIC